MERSSRAPVNNSERLTEHYTVADFAFSETAVRRDINNTPTAAIVKNLREMAYVLEDVERIIGYVPFIISGYRCAELNFWVGGSKSSAHLQGLAVDFKCPRFGTPLELCKVIAMSSIKYDQIIHEYSAWAHLGIGPQMRKMQLTKQSERPYAAGLF